MIVLTILKWIGIILGLTLAGIVALALLIFLLVLFVPFRYEVSLCVDESKGYFEQFVGTGSGWGERICYGFRISWILRAISIRKKQDSDVIVVRILGIPIKKIGGVRGKPPDSTGEDDFFTDMPEEEDTEESPGIPDMTGDVPKADSVREIEKVPDEEPPRDEEPKETRIETDGGPEANKKEKKKEPKVSIRTKFSQFSEKIHFIFHNLSCIIDFVRDRSTKRTIKKLKKETGALIRYVLPNRMRGNLTFGFGDPAWTGFMIGWMSLVPLSHKKHLTIRPNFEDKCLFGDARMRGRIRTVYMLRMAIRLYMDREVREVWKNLRQLKRKMQTTH